MAYADQKEMMQIARQKFIDGDYQTAENLLQQLLLTDGRAPEIFHMLGTIYYDRSQFSKAIKHFKKALEIDPNFTDASIGLSIILNDLGRYEEGKQIFIDAQGLLDQKKQKQADPFLEDKLAQQHLNIADSYLQFQRFEEALEQLHKAFALSQKPEIRLKIIDCVAKQGHLDKALMDLRAYTKDNPRDMQAQVSLGLYLYNSGRIAEAIDQWERVLFREPTNTEAKRYLRLAQQSPESHL